MIGEVQQGYLKGDLRRMLCVLAAIDQLVEKATIHYIAKRTGLDNRTVTTQIRLANEQAGVVIEKNDAVYTISDWGPIFKKSGARQVLADLATPKVQSAIAQGLQHREEMKNRRSGDSRE